MWLCCVGAGDQALAGAAFAGAAALAAAFATGASAAFERCGVRAARTWTSPWLGPATGPETKRRPRASSIFITLRFLVVQRSTPKWPPMRLPFGSLPMRRLAIDPG